MWGGNKLKETLEEGKLAVGSCTVAGECITTKIDEDGSKKITDKNLITPDELAAAFNIG